VGRGGPGAEAKPATPSAYSIEAKEPRQLPLLQQTGSRPLLELTRPLSSTHTHFVALGHHNSRPGRRHTPCARAGHGHGAFQVSEGRRKRAVGVFLLAISLVLVQLPVPSAAAPAPGALVCSAPSAPACAEVEPAALDDCCAPVPAARAVDSCCAPTADAEAPSEGGDPCCPTGCKHCPRPCCSPPLALIFRGGDLAVQLVAGPKAELPLPDHTSAVLKGVFHPPRG